MELIITQEAKKKTKSVTAKLKLYDLVSKLVFIKKDLYDIRQNYTQIEAAKYWQFDSLLPTREQVFKLKCKHVAWYIRNHMLVQHPIWNGSFLNGLFRGGWIPKRVNSLVFKWYVNEQIFNILNTNPFGTKPVFNPYREMYSWKNYALAFAYDKKSISYLAGVMACGRKYIDKKDGFLYASFSPFMFKDLTDLKIPIEKKYKKRILISPIFPALLQNYMPEAARIWNNVKNPYRGVIYSAILWKTYGLFEFMPNAIPYLKSRRFIFYRLQNDDLYKGAALKDIKSDDKRVKTGVMAKLDRLWVEYGLTELDGRFKMVIQEAKNIKKEQ